MNSKKSAKKRLVGSATVVIVLAVCLCLTTLALAYSVASTEDNLFQTGSIKVNLNDGKPVIGENEFLLEPGMTVEKDFFIENDGSWDVYYKLYLENLEGGLDDVLEVTVRDGETVLFSGLASDFTKEKTEAVQESLRLGERRNLTLVFYFPKDAESDAQSQYLSFDLCADAVQTKNNPKKAF